MAAPSPVYLEIGPKRVFACSIEWPGWCRSGRSEDQAMENLARYATRYGEVARRAGRAFPPTVAERLVVVERVPGSATTDFGAPGAIREGDVAVPSRAEAARMADLVEASWALFAETVARSPAVLRKGPRGGGRDRDAMVAHVVEAEAAYARKMGVSAKGDEVRASIAAALRGAPRATPPPPGRWPPAYAARRIAWHVLDHAWEMEDRAT